VCQFTLLVVCPHSLDYPGSSTKSAQVNKSDFLTFKFSVHLVLRVDVLNQLLLNAENPHLYSVLQEVLFVSDVRGVVLVVKAEAGRVAVILKCNNENDSFHAIIGWQHLPQGNAEALARTRDSLHANVRGLLFVSFSDLVGCHVLKSLDSNARLPFFDPLRLHLSSSEDNVSAAPGSELVMQVSLRLVEL
jgi:hypothetical protein